jgi:hypothetical protein
MMEACPDLGLPEAVEGLDLVLEAMLTGWSEDGADPECEAKEGDGTEAVGMVMGAVEAEVIVELSIGGQAMSTPMGEEGVLGEVGRDGGVEETTAKAAVQGDGVENLDFANMLDDESLDDVKGVQFGPGGGEVWEVPAWRRRWAAEAAGRLNQGVALEDVSDGGTAGDVKFIGALGAQGAEDGHRAILPQGIMLAEVVAQGEDALDHFGQEGVWRAKRAARAVSKIHTVQTLPGGALHPVLDVGQGQAGLASDLAQGDTAAGQEDQPAALSLREFFKGHTLASACFAVSFVPAPLRSASTTLTAKQELLMSV